MEGNDWYEFRAEHWLRDVEDGGEKWGSLGGTHLRTHVLGMAKDFSGEENSVLAYEEGGGRDVAMVRVVPATEEGGGRS
ncbi:hypothetical protein NL676_019169 [Syzygium grande]|nr:hypothetical protein NL676_019169 [Syzygium grande]